MSANTPEGKVKQKIKAVLEKYKPDLWYFMPRGTTFGRSGVPDYICCVCGYFVAIEAKAGRGKPSPLQTVELEAIRVANGLGFVVYENDIERLDDAIARLAKNASLVGV